MTATMCVNFDNSVVGVIQTPTVSRHLQPAIDCVHARSAVVLPIIDKLQNVLAAKQYLVGIPLEDYDKRMCSMRL